MRRAKRHANPNFANAPPHRVRKHAVDAHCGQQQRQRRKRRQQKEIKPLGRHRLRDNVLHTQNVYHRNVRANLVNSVRDRGSRAMREGVGAHGHRQAKGAPCLTRRNSHLRNRNVDRVHRTSLVERIKFHVADNAHNLANDVRRKSQRNVFAKRIFVRPESPRQRFANQRRPRSSRGIAIAEVPSTHNRNMHSLQVAWADQPYVHLRLLGHRQNRMSFDRKRLVRSSSLAQRQGIDHARRVYARKRAHPLQYFLKEVDLAGRRREPVSRHHCIHR